MVEERFIVDKRENTARGRERVQSAQDPEPCAEMGEEEGRARPRGQESKG